MQIESGMTKHEIQIALQDLINDFNRLSEIISLTGLKEPTVIT